MKDLNLRAHLAVAETETNHRGFVSLACAQKPPLNRCCVLARRSRFGFSAASRRMVPPIAGAWAQAYPTRTIKLIVPFPAGGPADLGELRPHFVGDPVGVRADQLDERVATVDPDHPVDRGHEQDRHRRQRRSAVAGDQVRRIWMMPMQKQAPPPNRPAGDWGTDRRISRTRRG